MRIISKLLVNNGYNPFTHNLRYEHAKNAGFASKYRFCNVLWHGTTNLISIFLPKWYLFPEPITAMGLKVKSTYKRGCTGVTVYFIARILYPGDSIFYPGG